MVGAVQNVEKTEIDETQSGLKPARVGPDTAGIASEFERANPAAGRQKPKNGNDAQAQPRKCRVNGKARLLRLDWIFEQHVEHGLVPIDVCIVRKGRPDDVGEGLVVRSEGGVRRERNTSR